MLRDGKTMFSDGETDDERQWQEWEERSAKEKAEEGGAKKASVEQKRKHKADRKGKEKRVRKEKVATNHESLNKLNWWSKLWKKRSPRYKPLPPLSDSSHYSPTDNECIVLHALHSDRYLTYEATHSLQIKDKGKDAVIGMPYLLYCYQFKRIDEVKINYVSTSLGAVLHSDLSQLFRKLCVGYSQLVSKHILAEQDITIFPLQLLKEGKSFFYTLLIHRDEKQILHVYLIGSQKNNKINKSMLDWAGNANVIADSNQAVPIEQNVEFDWTEEGPDVDSARVDTILTSHQQSSIDKRFYHSSYVEIIARLPIEYLADDKALKKYLCFASPARREEDSNIIAKVRACLDEEKESGRESTSELTFTTADLIENIDKPDQEREHSLTLWEPGEQANRILESKIHPVCSLLREEFNPLQLHTKQLLRDAINTIQKNYIDKYDKQSAKHSRQRTADYFVKLLEQLQVSEKQTDHEKIYRASLLLYSAYLSIKDQNSQLRHCLGQALAQLLDCEIEYRVHSKAASDVFKKRLVLFKLMSEGSFKSSFKPLSLKDEIKSMSKKLKKIDQIDTGWRYKINANWCCLFSRDYKKQKDTDRMNLIGKLRVLMPH